MHTSSPTQILARSGNLSAPENGDTGSRFETFETYYQISLALHDVPLRHVKIEASEGRILIVGDNVLTPSDDFDEWLRAGCARFSARIGLPQDADVTSILRDQVDDTLILTIARNADPVTGR